MMIGERIGQGLMADIHVWDHHRIVKLFRENVSLSTIQRELANHQIVERLDLLIPKTYGMVNVKEKCGILYERIHGPTMTEVISRKPWTADVQARHMARTHAEIHAKDVHDLPLQKDQLTEAILSTDRLSGVNKRKILRYLNRLPDGSKACHGDFHPDNILLSSQGWKVIDWTTATRGNPLADVARTVLIIRYATVPTEWPTPVRLWFEVLRRKVVREYLREYISLSGCSVRQTEEWELPVAAARLAEGISESEKKRLLKRVKELLKEIP
jgi:serine/threonine protein kinase